jgi:SAM-dependent methyltransferase
MLPFRDGSTSELAAVRALLDESGYTTAAVCARTGVAQIHELRTINQGRTTGIELDDALDALIHLFLDGLPVPAGAVERLLPSPGISALEQVGLVQRHPRADTHFAATVRLYPTHGLYIASDLETSAPGIADPEALEPPDHVFSAITSLTGTFLSQLPSGPSERFLELCSGTGIAALAAARDAKHAWAADLTERCTRFAEFNARLNGLENVTAVQGDLYEPVRGLTFDRIVAHPPYVPSTDTKMVYRDGGEDGEQVIRRILRGLPDHLEEGGRFYLTCVATDRKDAPLEERVREMVGERNEEFDLLIVSHYMLPPPEYYGRLAASGRITYALAEERTALFRELRAERIVYCSMVLQRHTAPRAAFTLRRERTDAAASPETEWLLGWTTRLAEEEVITPLLDAHPRLLPRTKLQVTHRVEAGEWKVDSCKAMVEYPFIRTVELSLNAAMLLTLCDGEHAVRDILQRLQQAGAISPEVPVESFAEFIRELVSEGILGVGGEPSPREGPPAPQTVDSQPVAL